ncbi:MAG: hypothetical protein AVDCRST_MAG68-2064 [uncultured Gemmatimonadetes bacterium]|uniref:Uncharacterized protein n=1 Tax=uncultured Gemmatimonadota bacterium TaxID=203437 RepID=A0A6J4L505_9BACT|nr:MAG: hypothetical protein AVDCRST_MAG68-2064 [uncultured Gemmatimonadota bacterium]
MSYRTRYGYSWPRAVQAEAWWRLEHLGVYRGADGGLCGRVRRYAYAKRKAAERAASPLLRDR